jgi:hypothetical protein
MNVINVVEEFYADTLTTKTASRVTKADIPLGQLEDLLDKVISYYDPWLDHEEQRRSGESREIFCPLDPYPQNAALDEKLKTLKALVLYFPTIAITDPIAEAIWPVWILRRIIGGRVPFTEEMEANLRADLLKALTLLATLRPFVEPGHVTLVPSAFALDDPVVQGSAGLFSKTERPRSP